MSTPSGRSSNGPARSRCWPRIAKSWNSGLGGSALIDLSSDGNFLGSAGGLKYVERPTITYAPISGRRFIELLFTPIPPSTIVFLIEAGYSGDLILRLTVQSVNGIRNRTWRKDFAGDPRFFHFAEFLERMQRNDWIGMRVERGDLSKELETVLFFRLDGITPEAAAEIAAVKTNLGLDAAATDFQVAYGPATGEPGIINIHSRSMLQILLELSAGVEVPAEHLERGFTRPPLVLEEGAPPMLMTIRSSTERPEYAYCALRYRDHWFWIEDSDQLSKGIFAFILLIFNIAESGEGMAAPLVTIPTG